MILFTLLNRITNYLIINASFIPYLGLNGKMGAAVFFYQLSRKTGVKIYEELAGELIDSVFENINDTMPSSYSYGLAGIGGAIEYLVKNKFVEADTDELLHEIDNAVFAMGNSEFSYDDYYAPSIYYLTRIQSQNKQFHINALTFIETNLKLALNTISENTIISGRFVVSLVFFVSKCGHLCSSDLNKSIDIFVSKYISITNPSELSLISSFIESSSILNDTRKELQSLQILNHPIVFVEDAELIDASLLVFECDVVNSEIGLSLKNILLKQLTDENKVVNHLFQESDYGYLGLLTCGSVLLQ